MKTIRFFSFAASLAGIALLAGCATGTTGGGAYHVTAYKPHDPNAVRVKLSTSAENVYVMEGDRVLMAAQCNVGEHGTTRAGNYTIFRKEKTHRSGTFGFARDGSGADAHKGQTVAVGYPMGYWCEFAPAYGFHEGFMWNEPHTHGCVRMHKEAAARIFQLVKVRKPV